MTTTTGAPAPAPVRDPAATAPGRRRGPGRRLPLPYLMIAPLLVVLAVVLAIPLVRLVVVSLQEYGLDQLIGGKEATFVGLAQYGEVLGSEDFWAALGRTVRFVAIAVGITVVLGLALAQLLGKVSAPVRLFLMFSLVTVWAMPPIIAMPIWRWLIDQRFGVLNYALDAVGVLPTRNFNWFRDPVTGWTVITAIVVWGALPFVVISLHAALTAVSRDHVEAARLDGAGAWRVFRFVTLPAIRPTLMIVVTLSIIWDYRVFAQIWLLRDIGANKDSYFTIGIWSYVESFSHKNFGYGAAIALIGVLLLGVLSGFAVRTVLRSTDEGTAR